MIINHFSLMHTHTHPGHTDMLYLIPPSTLMVLSFADHSLLSVILPLSLTHSTLWMATVQNIHTSNWPGS